MIWVVLFVSLYSLGYGLWAMLRPRKIAQQNEQFIASGEEAYFEQRRAWEAYGTTPPSNPAEVRRRGRWQIICGVIGLTGVAAYYLSDKGAN